MARIAHRSHLAVLCSALVLLGIGAGPALAGTTSAVKRTEDAPGRFTVRVDANAGVLNAVNLAESAGKILVTDGDTARPADSSCFQPPFTNIVGCSSTGVEAAIVNLGDLNDRATNSTFFETYMYGEGGNDVLHGGPKYDDLDGGDGNDNLYAGPGDFDLVQGGAGDDRLYGEAGRDQLVPGDGADYVDGGPGEDELLPSAGPDDYHGGSDPDLVKADTAARVIDGPIARRPESIDSITYQFIKKPINVSLDDVANDGEAGEGDNVHSDIERVLGGDVDDRIEGNSKTNILDGHWGDDKLYGYGGNDTLDGSDDQDEIRGGEGNDLITGGAGDDLMVGEAGNDTLDPTDNGRSGADTIRGGEGVDTVSYATLDDPVSVDFDGAADDGRANEADNVGVDVENAIGGKGDDKLTGSDAANLLRAGAGNDKLDGGTGADTLAGDEGDDAITSRDDVADTVTCGAGTDTVIADRLDQVAADCENVQLPQERTGDGTTDNGAGTSGGGTNGARACPSIKLAKGAVKVDSKGRARVRITARGANARPCAARIALRAGAKLGQGRVRLVSGKTVIALVKLRPTARKRLAKRGALKLTISVRTLEATGRRAAVTARARLVA